MSISTASSSSLHPPLPSPLPSSLPHITPSQIPPSQILTKLSVSLTKLESSLEPVLSHKEGWDGVLSELGTLERAKFEIMVGYAITDLIWMYLKSRGIDPSTHDVSAELERIRTYYAKVNAIEHPETRTSSIDKSAVNRFIKASIPPAQWLGTPSTSAAALARRQAEEAVAEQDVGMSTRFRHVHGGVEMVLPGADVEKGLDGDGDGEEEDEENEGQEDSQGDAQVAEDEEEGVLDISTEETEAFLQSLEEDLNRGGEEITEMSRTASSTSGSKRKRAEDLM